MLARELKETKKLQKIIKIAKKSPFFEKILYKS